MTEAPEEPRGFGRIWSTLRIPHYTPFFVANFAQFLFSHVAMMSMYWLMTGLTDSRLYITLVSFFQGATVFLLLPTGGVIADRVSKKKLLVAGRLGMVVLVVVMGWLVHAGVAEIVHLWIKSSCSPARRYEAPHRHTGK